MIKMHKKPIKKTNNKYMIDRTINALKVMEPVGYEYIRLGRDNDGGYVIINNIKNTDYLISMGVEQDVSFEQDISKMIKGMDIYDYSIEELPEHVENSRFFMEKVTNNYNEILDRVNNKNDLILKIDIEGSEWDFFSNIDQDSILRFKQIIMEAHWLIDDGSIYVSNFPIDIIEKINKTHQLVSLHPNNNASVIDFAGKYVPQVLELTFLRKDSIEFVEDVGSAKKLFQRNTLIKPDILEYL